MTELVDMLHTDQFGRVSQLIVEEASLYRDLQLHCLRPHQ
jgi:hypothetical protein